MALGEPTSLEALAGLRAVRNRGGAQTWSIAALLTFVVAFMALDLKENL